jgi:integrase
MAGKLTARGVESRAKRKGRYLDQGGLFLRVLDVGKRVYWVYRYRLNGKDRETSVGKYPAMSLADARDAHKLLVADVAQKIDVVGDRQKAKTAVATPSGKPTFGECADQFIALYEGAWRSRKHRTQWRQTLTQYCQPIWAKPVDQITTDDALAILKPIWPKTPETASRLRGRIETVIDAARARGHIDADRANPARWRGHLNKILPKPKKLGKIDRRTGEHVARDNYAAMPYEEVPAFMAKLARIDSTTARALQFLILTASRTGEALGMQWSEFSFDAALWTVPANRMKTDEIHKVPLSDQALAILYAQREARGQNPHVFPGRPMRPLSGMAMSGLMKRMGASETVHGFRSSFRVWCSEVEHAEFELAELCLSHRIGSKVSRAYNRTKMTERRRPVMSAWAAFVCGSDASNVIELRRAGA